MVHHDTACTHLLQLCLPGHACLLAWAWACPCLPHHCAHVSAAPIAMHLTSSCTQRSPQLWVYSDAGAVNSTKGISGRQWVYSYLSTMALGCRYRRCMYRYRWWAPEPTLQVWVHDLHGLAKPMPIPSPIHTKLCIWHPIHYINNLRVFLLYDMPSVVRMKTQSLPHLPTNAASVFDFLHSGRVGHAAGNARHGIEVKSRAHDSEIYSIASHAPTPRPHQLSSLAPTPIMVARGEKPDILTAALVMQAPRPKKSKWRLFGLVALLASVFALASLYADFPGAARALFSSAIRLCHRHRGDAKLCPQSDPLYPERHGQLWKSLGRDFNDDAFTKRAVAWLGGAVRIRYVSTVLRCGVFHAEC